MERTSSLEEASRANTLMSSVKFKGSCNSTVTISDNIWGAVLVKAVKVLTSKMASDVDLAPLPLTTNLPVGWHALPTQCPFPRSATEDRFAPYLSGFSPFLPKILPTRDAIKGQGCPAYSDTAT
eukprot:scaffold16162_cov71-Cyclotella_meneghiniana.AAC.23